MAAGRGGEGARELDQTPTWAVAFVVAVIIIVSIILEKTLHRVGHTFQKRKKTALGEALEKIKAELMVLGFISLILTFGQNYIARICISQKLGNTFLPCKSRDADEDSGHRRRLLWQQHRILAADSAAETCKKGYVPLISLNGMHQIHIFIFFLAVFHVFYSAITMTLGRKKIRAWKHWEREITEDNSSVHDPSSFRLTHETSFVRGRTSSWTKNPVVFYFVCFFQHILFSVQKADYSTLRHGFVSVHLAPGSKFNFQKYIKRSLEDDFKVVVGIPPMLWMTTVLYLLMNVKGWHVMFWLSVMPLVVLLAVGTKLQSIITRMAIEIKDRHVVVQGIPLVQVSDSHFWFSRPTLILHLIHLTLFQNAFEITYFIWISYEFGFYSCFHDDIRLAILRVSLGVGVQFLCSYITLPLYALVTQMGSHMKRSIFDEQTSKALKNWHAKVKKKNNSVQPRTRKLGMSSGDSCSSSQRSEISIDESRTEMGDTSSMISPEDTPISRTGNKDLLTNS